MADLARYRKYSDREHVLERPDIYIGSVVAQRERRYVLCDAADGPRLEAREVDFVPGLYKVVDEALVNARDHYERMRAAAAAGGDAAPVRRIDVDLGADGTVSVRNDGDGVDVAEHPEHGTWVPELIFATLRTSTNYDDSEERTTGGRNGFGVKLAFIWAAWGEIETVDHRRGLKYTQRFEGNLAAVGAPRVTRCKTKPYTRVTFLPDYARFGLPGLTDDMRAVLGARVFDLAAVTDASVAVRLNGARVPVRDLAAYARLHLARPGEPAPRVVCEADPAGRWQYCAAVAAAGEFEQVSFVNGIRTSLGGTHVDAVRNQLVRKICADVLARKKVSVPAALVKQQLWLMVNATVVNPAFDGQCKDTLKTPARGLPGLAVSDEAARKLAGPDLVALLTGMALAKGERDLAKTDGRKTRRITGVPQLEDAALAGGPRSAECTLILTEGLSAKAGVMSGLSARQRETFGVFPLRGKVLNVRRAGAAKIAANAEIGDVKKILGLQAGTAYETPAERAGLRYGRVWIVTDQDLDGYHIKGLLLNLFDCLWPALLRAGFVQCMSTPIVKARRGKKSVAFYTLPEYAAWAAGVANPAGWSIKYYKGLGTSTKDEFREYFAEPRVVEYAVGERCREALRDVFNEDTKFRKQWISAHDPAAALAPAPRVAVADFVDTELRSFSMYDNTRSIPSLVDGLKPSQRKILFVAMTSISSSELKVAQFGSKVAEKSAYHHGEASLAGAIINMAQHFVGSNNVALLEPRGQFGSRIAGGSDAAAPRYIFTKLAPVARLLFPEADDPILQYLSDEGESIEPQFFLPIIPFALVNPGQGIGTGFSTDIPPHDPLALADAVAAALRGEPLPELRPHFAGFRGTVADAGGGKFTARGVFERRGRAVRVTELPPGVWTDKFREFLDGLAADRGSRVADYASNCTDCAVDFAITLSADMTDDEVAAYLRLEKSVSTNNMHLFDADGRLRRFASAREIVEAYVPVRLAGYVARRAHRLRAIADEDRILENKVRFIREQCDGSLDLRRKKTDEMRATLEARGYFANGAPPFAYLLDMPMKDLLEENIAKLEANLAALRAERASLEAATPESLWLADLDAFRRAAT